MTREELPPPLMTREAEDLAQQLMEVRARCAEMLSKFEAAERLDREERDAAVKAERDAIWSLIRNQMERLGERWLANEAFAVEHELLRLQAAIEARGN